MPLYTIRHQQIGGTEFGIYNLVKGLAQTEARLSLSYGRESDLSPEFRAWLTANPGVRARCVGGLPGPKAVRFFEETLFGLSGSDDDWLLFPNYFSSPKRPGTRRRRAVLLHDIQYRVYPHYHSAKRRAWLDAYLPRMFRSVDQVLLVSHSEANLVREHFGAEAAAKCAVIYNAIDWTRFEGDDAMLPEGVRARLDRRYILSVCHLFPHKNVGTLLEAFAGLARDDADIRLYLVGAQSERNLAFIRAGIPAELVDRVEILGFVDDRSLGAYYAHASVFALPSLYEGFGMPAVEAMGFGVPTLVSRAFSLPEVTFHAAEYVESPTDAGEWQARLAQLLASPNRPDPETLERIRTTYAPRAVGNALLDALHRHG